MKTYAKRVRELEEEGCTTSDAQGVADVELREGKIAPDGTSAHLSDKVINELRVNAFYWGATDARDGKPREPAQVVEFTRNDYNEGYHKEKNEKA